MVVDKVEGVGRYYVLYAVHDVGVVSPSDPRITHLVAPLSYYRPCYAGWLASIILSCFPCFFGSSMDFEEGSEVERVSDVGSERLEMTQDDVILGLHLEISCFSDSSTGHGQV